MVDVGPLRDAVVKALDESKVWQAIMRFFNEAGKRRGL